MFTRIPNEKGAECAASCWEQYRRTQCPNHPITAVHIRDALLLVLRHNVFEFHGGLYKPVRGTAMGSSCSVVYANAFMGRFFEAFQNHCVQNGIQYPVFLGRLLDDVFGLWAGTKNEINLFVDHLNQFAAQE